MAEVKSPSTAEPTAASSPSGHPRLGSDDSSSETSFGLLKSAGLVSFDWKLALGDNEIEPREFKRLAKLKLQAEALTAAQVEDLLARKGREGGYARVSLRALAYSLRAFFRFAEGCACCRPGLADAVGHLYLHRDV